MRTLSPLLNYQKKTGRPAVFLCGSIVFCALLYLYFLNTIISSMIAARTHTAAIEEVRGRYQYLEERYLSRVALLSETYAEERGFVPQSDEHTIVEARARLARR